MFRRETGQNEVVSGSLCPEFVQKNVLKAQRTLGPFLWDPITTLISIFLIQEINLESRKKYAP